MRAYIPLFFMASARAAPIWAGVLATTMPASFRASCLAAAVPLPPATMAPAWPMRRPLGAVAPAMKAATGFLQLFLIDQLIAFDSLENPLFGSITAPGKRRFPGKPVQ